MNTLPEYFVIFRNANNPLWNKYIEWLNEKYNRTLRGDAQAYYGYGGKNLYNWDLCQYSLSDYCYLVTVITLEQWDNIVNKKDMNKEIIGYKLVKPEYREAVLRILNAPGWSNFPMLDSVRSSLSIEGLKKAGVLDIWFEPCYKDEKTLPKINGYDGKLESNFVVYGCAKFNIKYIEELHGLIGRNKVLNGNKDIKSIKLDSGVEITIEQIKEIYEYIKSKD